MRKLRLRATYLDLALLAGYRVNGHWLLYTGLGYEKTWYEADYRRRLYSGGAFDVSYQEQGSAEMETVSSLAGMEFRFRRDSKSRLLLEWTRIRVSSRRTEYDDNYFGLKVTRTFF